MTEFVVKVEAGNRDMDEVLASIKKVFPVEGIWKSKAKNFKAKQTKAETPEQTMVKRVRPAAHLHTPQMLELAATRRAEAEAARKATCVNMLTSIMMNNQYASMDFLVREMNKTVLRPFKSKKWTLSNIEPYYVAAMEFPTGGGSVQSVALAAE